MMQRALIGWTVGISVSESDESATLGFPIWQVNRTTLQIVAALFGQGATVLFGHDWRDDGVMAAVYSFARQVHVPLGGRSDFSAPLLINILPWPDHPSLSKDMLDRLKGTLQVEFAGLPDELLDFGADALGAEKDSRLYRYVRARALTHLRHKLNEVCNARLCIGGRRSGGAGRFPGVVEEALFAIRSSKPLYVAGVLGGASNQIISALEGRKMPSNFCESDVRTIYEKPPIRSLKNPDSRDATANREAIWEEFASAGLSAVSASTRLTRKETTELFHTKAIDRIIELVLKSFSRLKVQ